MKTYTKYYVKLMEPIVDKTSDFLDNFFFSKFPKTINLAVNVFGFTSKLTSFFLFHYLGNLIYLVFVIYVFIDNGNNFTYIYYATLHKGLPSFLVNCYEYLNWSFFSLIIFLSVLFEVAFLNTILVSIPKIKERILVVYGENYLRNYGYNSRISSLARTGEKTYVFALSLSAAFLGASAGQIYESSSYQSNYQAYLDAQTKNIGVILKPPERSSLLRFPFFK